MRRAAGAARVTVLLPVYNGGESIDRALDSLTRQTLPDWDCVAADDGSTDDTWERLAAWAGRDGRIRPIRLTHSGITAALHAALAEVLPLPHLPTGSVGAPEPPPYLARLDADDECHPERLARQIAFLDSHPEVGLVGCRVRFGGDAASAGGFARHVDWLNSLVTPRDIALARFRESPLAHPSVLFRTSLAVRHGWYADGPFPEDYELWLRWLDAGVVMAKTPETLLTWNDPPNRLTRTDVRYAEEAFACVRAHYLARYLARYLNRQSGGQRGRAAKGVWIWGAGRVSRRRASHLLAHGVTIRAWIDIDPKKIGNRVAGVPVLGREALPLPGQGYILVFLSAHGAAEEAADWLTAHGYAEGDDFLLCS